MQLKVKSDIFFGFLVVCYLFSLQCLGKLEAAGKRLEKAAEEMSPEFLAKQESERQAMIARQYEGKGYAGGVFGS